MKVLIITGMSGAGKTQTVNALEDLGCYCVDNMPPELIPKFAEIYSRAEKTEEMVAIVCDIRGGKLFGELAGKLEDLTKFGYEYEILFLEASDEVLLKRYKETRREHPLAIGGRIPDGIRQERELLRDLRQKATRIIDTTLLSTGQLKEMIISAYGKTQAFLGMTVHLVSFGFKNGIPADADLVFDVRFLPNPFYLPELKQKTGLDKAVQDYVMGFEQSCEFLQKLEDMLKYLIPYYQKEGKTQLVVGIGCTGGQHRSVTMVENLIGILKDANYNVLSTHRELQKKK